ncbi:zinc-binding dehydrogenase [Mesorhizobium sp. M0833]|uniref:zinc-binding dehydrogenase n=1 Tax=Mesorhizobium sp. M0833 TaxID=2957009 RepID=UPI00333C133A
MQYLSTVGARTATTVSSELKAAFALRLGADIAIRYRSEDVNEKLRSWSGKDGADACSTLSDMRTSHEASNTPRPTAGW